MMARRTFLLAIIALVLLVSVRTSHAGLSAVGPTSAGTGNFPVWYQDSNGRTLELCLSATASVNGPLCLLLANPGIFDPAQPVVFPTNFPDESFWFAADTILTAGGVNLTYVAALEAAFGGGDVVDGDQISFARIRIRADLPVNGTYIVTHPYGVETFVVNVAGAGREINMTRDIGIGSPGNFTGALGGNLGPFLTAVSPAPPAGFIGDPNINQTVSGSPLGTNFVRIQCTTCSPPIDVQTDLFTVAGKIYPIAVPTPLAVERTTYSRTAAETQIDAFAFSPPTATLDFRDPLTPMTGDAEGHFFGQVVQSPGSSIPATLTISATNAGNTLTMNNSNVTDVVSITKVEYDPATGTLIIEADSSDEASPPTVLTASGFGPLSLVGPGPTQILTVTGLGIPPATITVTSGASGSDTEEVVILP